MASFTDTQPPRFNPYIQQQPVEAMVEVGVGKQKAHTEGVQKIQTQIDNIAGLDVVRDIDKAYLQSKINELGNNLRTVAAGDFGNFQLTNSVGGMIQQVGQDGNVQNAVQSAAKYRKEIGAMEAAEKEGKGSVANRYVFGVDAGAWLNSSDLKQSFNAKYTPYTDVKKKAMEAIKALHPKLQLIDIPFEVDANNNINTRKIADAMIKHKVEGVDETQIQQAIFASMTPDDLNQLNIDAKYTFRGVTTEQLVGKATSDYEENKQTAIRDLAFLNTQKEVTTDPAKLAVIEKRIKDYKELLGTEGTPGLLEEQYNKNLKTVTTNPDGVKFDLYKNGFIKEFSNAFSWKTESKEYVTNPLRQQQNWVAEMKHKQEIENRNRYEFGVNTKIKERELGFREREINLKAMEVALKDAELNGDPNASVWTPLGNETDNTLQAQALFTDHVASVDNRINSSKEDLKSKGYSEAAINKMLNSWKDAQGVAANADVPARAVKTIQDIVRNQNYLQSLEKFEKKTKLEAAKEAGVSKVIDEATRDRPNLSVTTKTGEKITLTSKELIEVLNKEKRIETPTEYGIQLVTQVDPRDLTLNQRRYVDAVYGTSGKLNTETRTKLNNIVQTYRPNAQKIKTAQDKADVLYKQKLGEFSNEFVPQIKAVATGKQGEPPPLILSRLSALVTAADNKKIAADDNYDKSTASEMLLDKNKNDTRVFIMQDGEKYQVWLKSESNPDNIQKLRLTASDVAKNFGTGYINNRTQESARLTLGKGSTSLTGNATEAVMQKQFGDFPNVRSLKVAADLEQDMEDPDLYIPKIYLKLKNGNYTAFEISGNNKLSRVGYEQGKTNLNNLNDEILLKYLKQEYPNFDYSTIDNK